MVKSTGDKRPRGFSDKKENNEDVSNTSTRRWREDGHITVFRYANAAPFCELASQFRWVFDQPDRPANTGRRGTPRGHAGGRARRGRRGTPEAVRRWARRENPDPLSPRSKIRFTARDLGQITVLLEMGQKPSSRSKRSGSAGLDMP